MHFAILGPLLVEIAGVRLQLSGLISARILTTLLLSSGKVVPVARLVEAAWDEDPPPTATHQVRKAIADLRQRIPQGHSLIATDGPGYRADVTVDQLDLTLFTDRLQQARESSDAGALPDAARSLREALALWRGAVMSESGGPLISAASAVLEERRLAAVGQLIEIRLALGESSELVEELRQLIVDHPLRETFRGYLMLALHRSGRRAEALAEYAGTRRLLVEELGVGPGQQLNRVHEMILRGSPEAAPPEPTEPIGAPAPAALTGPAPCTLPHDLQDFAGRESELTGLMMAAHPPGDDIVRIISIEGMGGSGKTALAIRAAHRLAPLFPDGQLYVDLRGFTPGEQPRQPVTVLATLLRTLGLRGEQIPEDLEAVAALWRSTLAGQRMLLLLDNAAHAAQVRPLLPGAAGCSVLITSRHRMTGLDGSQSMALGLLSSAESIALTTAALGRQRSANESQEIRELVALCGHLPLALRIAVGRLRSRPHWSTRYLVDRLRNEARRLDELRSGERGIEATLQLSYLAMDESHRDAIRLLGLHPGDEFDTAATAALLGIGVHEAEDVLEHLVDVHLIETREIGRYTFHDLVRRFIRRLPARTAEPAAFRQLLDYYLAVSEWACRIRYPGREATDGWQSPEVELPVFADPEQAEAFFEREHGTLLAAVERALEQGLYRQAVHLARNLLFFLNTRSRFPEYQHVASLAVAAARRLDEPRTLRLSLSNLSVVQWKLGRFAEGIVTTSEALDIALTLDDRDGEASCLNMLGLMLSCLGFLDEAEWRLQQAVTLYGELTAGRQEGYACSNLSTVYSWRGRYREACAAAERAILLSRGFGPYGEEITALTDLAIAQLAGDDLESARLTIDQALTLGDERYVPENLALTFAVASKVYQRLRRADRADAYAVRSLELLAAMGTTIRRATVENIVGSVRFQAGDLRQALQLYESAYAHADTIGYRIEVARALTGMADVQAALGQHQAAQAKRDRADSLYATMAEPSARKAAA
ncbi:BTAD domain-containing putative transcriptional regulator [Actinoplanes sp. NPDC051851]|uniref:AfsR/SARP family transcriptional regulator n=1 Tax=Actinoplanes sp. NPDC051851 TaxID=3154753 RepID=UPI003418337F